MWIAIFAAVALAGIISVIFLVTRFHRFRVLERREIRETFPLTEAQAADLIAMTPLTQGIEKEQLDVAALRSVTIHLHILAGRPQ